MFQFSSTFILNNVFSFCKHSLPVLLYRGGREQCEGRKEIFHTLFSPFFFFAEKCNYRAAFALIEKKQIEEPMCAFPGVKARVAFCQVRKR